jgi:dihydrofolate reductase
MRRTTYIGSNLEVRRRMPNTIQQYLRTGLADELHVAISPVLLGGGERLFEGIDVRALGYEYVQFVASEKATHIVLRRQRHNDG